MEAVELDKVPWMRFDGSGINSYTGFLKEIELESVPEAARISLTADLSYKLYVNGRFVNSGPAPFKLPDIPVDKLDLLPYLTSGVNTVFIIAHFSGVDLKYNTAGEPGVVCAIHINKVSGGEIVEISGTDWKTWNLSLWNNHTPRMNWALDYLEDSDVSHPVMVILSRYATEDYHTSAVPNLSLTPADKPFVWDRPEVRLRDRTVPDLKWELTTVTDVMEIWDVSTEIHPLADNAVRLLHERKTPIWDNRKHHIQEYGKVTLERRRGEPGIALLYDNRKTAAGDIVLSVSSDSEAVIDICFSEVLIEGFPSIFRTGFHYFSRIHFPAGISRFRMFGYSDFRYIALVLKDFEDRLSIDALEVFNRQADLDYDGEFHSPDPILNEVYDICRRSVILNTQDSTHDCNSREKGTYIGDSLWISEMSGYLSGDFSFMKQLLVWIARELPDHGIPLCNLHGLGEYLIDYSLMPPVLLNRYLCFTGDEDTALRCFPAIDAIITAFQRTADENGLLQKERLDTLLPREGIIFLDHPGVGFHYSYTTGIDRRDYSAGLNLFYLWSMKERDAAARELKLSVIYEKDIGILSNRIREIFYNSQLSLFADSVPLDLKGDFSGSRGYRPSDGSSTGYSQIVNALAVLTGIFEGREAREAMITVLDVDMNPWVSQGTPYTYLYLLQAMMVLGMEDLAVDVVKKHWVPMLEGGATTAWEGFRSEFHDSSNHAWSSGPVMLIYRGIMGLIPSDPGFSRYSLTPLLTIFPYMEASFRIPQGRIMMSWSSPSVKERLLKLSLPSGAVCRLQLPGEILFLEGGVWEKNLFL